MGYNAWLKSRKDQVFRGVVTRQMVDAGVKALTAFTGRSPNSYDDRELVAKIYRAMEDAE